MPILDPANEPQFEASQESREGMGCEINPTPIPRMTAPPVSPTTLTVSHDRSA